MPASGCTVVRQAHLKAVVGAFMIGCAVLLMVVGCAGVRSEASQEEEQGHTEATKEQARSVRCEGTRSHACYSSESLPNTPFSDSL
jgi:uncharacterized protein YceK